MGNSGTGTNEFVFITPVGGFSSLTGGFGLDLVVWAEIRPTYSQLLVGLVSLLMVEIQLFGAETRPLFLQLKRFSSPFFTSYGENFVGLW